MAGRSVAFIVAVILTSCRANSDGDGALSRRVYVPEIQRDEVLGQWTPASQTPGGILSRIFGRASSGERRMLAIKRDGTCSISPEFVRFVLKCEHASPSAEATQGGCVWRIDGKPGEQGVAVIFEGPGGKRFAATYGAFRHVTDGDVALLGTCGWGDAYGLYRPRVQESAR